MTAEIKTEKNGEALSLPAGEILLKSYRRSLAGSMRFLTFCPVGYLENGQRVELWQDGELVFAGRIFSILQNGETAEALCYDDKRYLLYQDSRVFPSQSIARRTADILQARGLSYGKLAGEDIFLPGTAYDGKSPLFMIGDALEEAQAQGHHLSLVCQKGKLCLLKRQELIWDKIVDDQSIFLAETQRDIDGNTFNRVQIMRKQSRSGKRDYFIAEDKDSVKKWGPLSYYLSALQKDSDSYLNQKAASILLEKNRECRQLHLKMAGDFALTAGASLWVDSEQVGEKGLFWISEASTRYLDGSCITELYGEEWKL